MKWNHCLRASLRGRDEPPAKLAGTGAAGNRGWMSAALPVRCCEFLTPPTSLFSSLQRYPEETTTGIPKCSRSGSRTVWQRYCRFSATMRSSALARSRLLSMQLAMAVAERVNSFKEKMVQGECNQDFLELLRRSPFYAKCWVSW